MVFADLHMHSSASDGTLDATRIADLAAQTEGLHAISITDHDSLAALEDARLSCAMHDVDFRSWCRNHDATRGARRTHARLLCRCK